MRPESENAEPVDAGEQLAAGDSEQPAGSVEAEEVEHDLEQIMRERDEYLDHARRAKADFENYRKRVTRDLASAETRGIEKLALPLLSVVDNLERALAAAQPRDRDQPESHLAEGVRLVAEELGGVLKQNSIESFEPEGDKFDPNWHEAVVTRSEDGSEAGTVLEVMQKGYKLDGAVLRPARVVVAESSE